LRQDEGSGAYVSLYLEVGLCTAIRLCFALGLCCLLLGLLGLCCWLFLRSGFCLCFSASFLCNLDFLGFGFFFLLGFGLLGCVLLVFGISIGLGGSLLCLWLASALFGLGCLGGIVLCAFLCFLSAFQGQLLLYCLGLFLGL
jgi:hypothetical protein